MDLKNRGALVDLCKWPVTAGYPQSIISIILILLVALNKLAPITLHPSPFPFSFTELTLHSH